MVKFAVVKYLTDYDIPETGIRGEYYKDYLGYVFFCDGITSNWLTDSYPKEVILGYIDSLFMLSNEQRAVVEIKSRHTVFQSTKNIELTQLLPLISAEPVQSLRLCCGKRTTRYAGNVETEFFLY